MERRPALTYREAGVERVRPVPAVLGELVAALQRAVIPADRVVAEAMEARPRLVRRVREPVAAMAGRVMMAPAKARVELKARPGMPLRAKAVEAAAPIAWLAVADRQALAARTKPLPRLLLQLGGLEAAAVAPAAIQQMLRTTLAVAQLEALEQAAAAQVEIAVPVEQSLVAQEQVG